MKKVKLKSREEFKRMEQAGEIEHLFTSDSGEITHYGTKGGISHIQSVWWDDYGDEYLVVDHPNPISKEAYEARKIFFEDGNEEEG